MKKKNILNNKLKGKILIEASAGTGKTFTIIMIYLRLLLGINLQKKQKPFKINKILVLTFTKKTTQELKIRIKKNILQLKKTLIKKKEKKKFKFFIKNIINIKKAIILLNKAEKKINNLSIYTIHSFCKKILEYYPNKFTNKNNKIKITDSKKIYLKATIIFWKKYFYSLPKKILIILIKYFQTPKILFKKIYPIYKKKYIKKKNIKKKKIIKIYYEIIKNIKKIKKKWIKINKKKNKKFPKRTLNLFKKINNWAYLNTENDYLIKEIEKIKKNKYIKKKKIKKIKLILKIIKKKKKYLIKNFLLYSCKKILIKKKKIKKKKKYIEYDDIIKEIYNKISFKKNNILYNIRKKYPIALIDEFQDTDKKQYKIFKKIYKKKKTYLLLLIGDPKQSIYSFRGANIKTYIKAKKQIQIKYSLNKNWRSSYKLNKIINFLFKNKNPFIFKKIKYYPVKSPNKKKKYKIIINNKKQKPLNIFFKKKIINKNKYIKWSAKQCANKICKWIIYSQKNKAHIYYKNSIKKLKAKDITIIVRDKYEAKIIKKYLKKLNIKSIYHSNKKNIYKTKESKEILLILNAVLNPINKKKFYRAISTNIITKNIREILKIKKKKYLNILIKFNKYNILWKKNGIFSVIWNIIKDFNIFKKNNFFNKLNSNTNNILQIGILLQKKTKKIKNRKNILEWFKEKINKKNNKKKKNIKKYIYNKNAINITTIHMSKGLEYLITWIPFLMNFKKIKKHEIYDNKKKENKKRISEEIRLLYVALTRSIINCNISIAPIITSINNYKKKKYIENHKSALGFLIQKGKHKNIENFLKIIKKIKKNKNIKFYKKKKKNKKNKNIKFYKKTKKILILPKKIKKYNFKKKYKNNLFLTSYSKLNNKKIIKNNKKNNKKIKKYKKKNNKINNHNFPKGKKIGIFFHEILKKIKFSKKNNKKIIKKIIKKYKIKKKYFKYIIKWINKILNFKLNKKKLCLSKLKKKNYIKEMEFYMKINTQSKKTKILNNIKIKGFIKGYIDLIFKWKKKYYILDYKSNWLGKSEKKYTKKKIKKTIIKNKYDLQYKIYSIALHKYLKKKKKKYKFKKHFGGIYYIFLRGINKNKKNNGIFYLLPKYKLIKKLNKIFN
ncbi:exodeoxyribonuclease V subunit beta [Buchnera aphidicola]|uniref:exodeoxyribonuclease V subunit beta n=1 Tax=Buchnera aphidicola TaxID=9 RepID=UPI0031B8860C